MVASHGRVFISLANVDVCTMTLLALNAQLLACFPFWLRALPRQCWKCLARAPGGPAGSCLPGEPR